MTTFVPRLEDPRPSRGPNEAWALAIELAKANPNRWVLASQKSYVPGSSMKRLRARGFITTSRKDDGIFSLYIMWEGP